MPNAEALGEKFIRSNDSHATLRKGTTLSTESQTDFRPVARKGLSAARHLTAEAAAWALLALACAVALAVLLQRPANADTSWGLTLADAVLSGKRLYEDILETNPPMTVFLHLPAAIVARWGGISPELAQHLFTLGALLVATIAAVDTLRTSGRAADVPGLVVAVAVFQVVPWLNTFGEREQFAAMAMLPFVALWTPRGTIDRRPWRGVLLAGLGGGLATAIKPVFCLCLIVPAVHDAIVSRRLSALFRPEYWIAAAVATIYMIAAVITYPEFFTRFSPVLADTYFHYRQGLWQMIAKPELGNLLLLTGLGWACGARSGAPPWATAATLVSIGFAAAFVLQAKGYLNHEMAVLAMGYQGAAGLIVPAAIAALRAPRRSDLPTMARIVAAPLLVFLTLWLYGQVIREVPYRSMALVADARRVPDARTVLAISPDLDIGHPFARSAGLRYVGSTCSQWLAYTAMTRRDERSTAPDIRRRMDGHVRRDLDRLAADIGRERPDLIALDVEQDYLKAYGPAAEPVRRALSAYRPVSQRGDVQLLVRRDRRPSTGASPPP